MFRAPASSLLLAAILIGDDPASGAAEPAEPFVGDLGFAVESVLATDGKPTRRFFPGEPLAIELSLVNKGSSELRLREGRSYKSSTPGEWHGIVSIRAAEPGHPPIKPAVREAYRRDRFEMDFPSHNQVIPPDGSLTARSPFWDFDIDEVGEYCFRASYYLRESALVGRPTTTLEETTSTSFCFEVVPFAELGIKVTPERAVSIAGKAFAEAGYGEAALIKGVSRRGDGDWYTGHDFAPTGGGWHVLIVIDGQTGEVKRLERGCHRK